MSARTIARARAVAKAFMNGEPVPLAEGQDPEQLPESLRAATAFAAGTLAALAEELAFRLERAEARMDELGEPHL